MRSLQMSRQLKNAKIRLFQDSSEADGKVMTLQEVVNLVKQLSLVDKVRLIKQVVPEIEQELVAKNSTPRQSLWGLCADLGKAPSADEIDRVRREEWASFPREDF